jgi:Protein of unknown function (DUF3303)
MKYLVQWHLSEPSAVRSAAERFLKTGGKLPEGVKLVGRWFGTNGKGCLVVEASDPKQVFEAVTEYAEFMQIEATPAIEDQEAGEVLGKLFG